MADVKTELGTVDVNLEELIGVDTDNVSPQEDLLQKEDAQKFFEGNKKDDEFINQMLEKGRDAIQKEVDENGNEKPIELTPQQERKIDNAVNQFGNDLVETPQEEQNNVGFNINSLIEKKILLGFEDKKAGEEYTPEEVEELINANLDKVSKDSADKAIQELYGRMPESVKKIMTYAVNGASANDMKSLYRQLSTIEEQQSLDVNDANGQKEIIRQYLTLTKWGDENEIEDEISSLADKNELEKKAKQFKPKLDKYNEEEVNKKIQEQQEINKQREQRNMEYIKTVGSALSQGNVNGIPISNNVANNLFQGLIQNKFKLSNGNNGNMLSYYIDQYQWVKPNPTLLAEALWLLADPDGYKESVTNVIKKDFDERTFRKLQTETQQTGKPSTQTENTNDVIKRRMAGTEQKNNFFKR